MKQKNIAVNAGLNVIRQTLAIIFPLITYPYLIRVLGLESLGKVDFSRSLVSYFTYLAMLGVQPYSVREGARIRDDAQRFGRFANEVFTINLGSTAITYLLLAGAVLLLGRLREYRSLLFLLSCNIGLTVFGLGWVNEVYEDYLLITLRSIVTYALSAAVLFLFIHSPADYYWYAIALILPNLIICVSNWLYCRKYVRLRPTRNPNIRRHIRPLLVLFANAVTILLYVQIGITMLGWMKGDYIVGIYSSVVNVYSVVKSTLAAIYAVTIPRFTWFFFQKEHEKIKSLAGNLCSSLLLLMVPCAVGLMCLAREIVMFLGIAEVDTAARALRILSGALCFAIFGGFTTSVLNVTMHREKENLLATCLSAGLNFAVNLILIPRYSLYAAAFTTLLSEAFVVLFCLARMPQRREILDGKALLRAFTHSAAGSGMIFVAYWIVRTNTGSFILRLVLTVAFSVPLYAAVLFLLRDPQLLELCRALRNKCRI